MKRIGEYWIPDIDAREGYNLERSKAAFQNAKGIQIQHLLEALKWINEYELAIDGGANVGSWSRVLAEHFKSVHAFEPCAEAYACLERNIADWNLSEKVKAHNIALSDKRESVEVKPPDEGRRTVAASVVGPGNTQALPIDSFKLPNCSFLKLDLEGYEARALKGASETIKKFRPWILIENKMEGHSLFRRKSEPERILGAWNYQVVKKIGERQIDWLFRAKDRS